MTETTNRTAVVQAALDGLVTAVDALDDPDRIVLGIAARTTGAQQSAAPEIRAAWAAIADVIDGTANDSTRLVNTFEVVGLRAMRAVRMGAKRLELRGGAYAEFWGALWRLAEAVARSMAVD